MAMKEPFIHKIKEIWIGNPNRERIIKYFFGIFSIYVIGTFIAMLSYPNGFSFTHVYTSYLGGNLNNPNGYMFYNSGELFTGILLIPFFVYYYKNLRENGKKIVWLGSFLGILGLLGFAALGIFYQGADPTGHKIATWFAFGGFGLSAFLFLIIFIGRIIAKHDWPKFNHLILVYGGMFLLLATSILFTEGKELIAILNIPEEYFGDHFTEWLFVFTVLYWLVSMAIVAPESKYYEK